MIVNNAARHAPTTWRRIPPVCLLARQAKFVHDASQSIQPRTSALNSTATLRPVVAVRCSGGPTLRHEFGKDLGCNVRIHGQIGVAQEVDTYQPAVVSIIRLPR